MNYYEHYQSLVKENKRNILINFILGKHAPQAIWPWLLQRMDQAGSNDKIRIVLLVIYRHLVYAFGNDAPTTIFDYKSLLVSSLRPTLNTATLKVFYSF
jgi:hypothetical protein